MLHCISELNNHEVGVDALRPIALLNVCNLEEKETPTPFLHYLFINLIVLCICYGPVINQVPEHDDERGRHSTRPLGAWRLHLNINSSIPTWSCDIKVWMLLSFIK